MQKNSCMSIASRADERWTP